MKISAKSFTEDLIWFRTEVLGIQSKLEMARKLDVSPYKYQNWELGRSEPSREDFIKILQACPDEQTRSRFWAESGEKPLDSKPEGSNIGSTRSGKKKVFLEPLPIVIPKPRGKK